MAGEGDTPPQTHLRRLDSRVFGAQPPLFSWQIEHWFPSFSRRLSISTARPLEENINVKRRISATEHYVKYLDGR